MASASKAEREALKTLLAIIHVEAAFSRAMAERNDGPIAAVRLDREIGQWLTPHLPHRYAALSAALRNDRLACEQHLTRAKEAVSSSLDLALPRSEQRLADYVLGVLAENPLSASPAPMPGPAAPAIRHPAPD